MQRCVWMPHYIHSPDNVTLRKFKSFVESSHAEHNLFPDRDGYIMEPSNSSGELDAPSDDSGDLRPWEIFVPPISAQHVNPCQMDISPNVDTTTSSSLDMMPAMNWSAMALGKQQL